MITAKNFVSEVEKSKGQVALDVWNESTLDCRYHSVLWEDLGFTNKIAFKKLDGGKYPALAKRLKVTKFPTLLLLKEGKEVARREGYLYSKDKEELRKLLKGLT